MGSRVLRWLFWAAATLGFVLYPSMISAGTIKLAWSPVNDADLASYRVYYGTISGVYSQWEVAPKEPQSCMVSGGGSQQSVSCIVHEITNLQDCEIYYVAVKAVDANGNESVQFSNEVSGMSAPQIAQVTPSEAKQGVGNLNVLLTGNNFDTQAQPDFGPDIIVNSFNSVSCTQIQANISIAPAGRVNSPPALPRTVSVVNQGGPMGEDAGGFTVLFNERRADIDASGRVMTRDLEKLRNAFGTVSGNNAYNINSDLNGDGVIDGADYTLYAVWHGKMF